MSTADFEKQTIKAIKDLQEVFATDQARYLALTALLKSVLQEVPLHALKQIREHYLNEVNAQAAQLPHAFQRPEIWNEFEGLLDDLVELRVATAKPAHPTQQPS